MYLKEDVNLMLGDIFTDTRVEIVQVFNDNYSKSREQDWQCQRALAARSCCTHCIYCVLEIAEYSPTLVADACDGQVAAVTHDAVVLHSCNTRWSGLAVRTKSVMGRSQIPAFRCDATVIEV